MEPSRARISVAVPSYNHGRYLERCLRSIFAQTRRPDELIVIDDGSKDDSPRVAERVLADAPCPSELIVRPNRGVALTLEEALSRTHGEYFAYAGSDDMWLPRRLELGAGALESQKDAVLSYGGFKIIDDADQVIGYGSTPRPDEPAISRRDLFEARRLPPNPTVTYRREPLARFGWRKGSRVEDYELVLHLSGVGPFVAIPEVVGCTRRHAGNTSGNHVMMLEEFLQAQQRTAAELGFGSADVERARALTTFKFACYLNDEGDRRAAARLFLRALPAGATFTQVLRQAAKMASPKVVRDLNRRRHERAARRRFGGIP